MNWKWKRFSVHYALMCIFITLTWMLHILSGFWVYDLSTILFLYCTLLKFEAFLVLRIVTLGIGSILMSLGNKATSYSCSGLQFACSCMYMACAWMHQCMITLEKPHSYSLQGCLSIDQHYKCNQCYGIFSAFSLDTLWLSFMFLFNCFADWYYYYSINQSNQRWSNQLQS